MSKHKVTPEKSRKIVVLAVMDVLSILCSFFLGLWLRFDFRFKDIPSEYLEAFLPFVIIWCVISVVVFAVSRLYQSIWSFASVDELFHAIGAYAILAVIGGVYLFVKKNSVMPYSFYVLGFVFSMIATVSMRFSYRILREIKLQLRHMTNKGVKKNIMIIGAGDAGRIMVNEFENNTYAASRVVCVIDDNPNKKSKRLCGVPIVGNRYDIPEAVKEYNVNSIIFAIPTSTPSTRKEIIDICATTGCQVQVVPSIYKIADNLSVSKLRDVDPQDLLGRDPINVNMDEIFAYISGKTVLVTGGGGSIGSELCRQIANAHPKQLIIFDIYENNAYDIQMELKRNCPELNLEVLIGSVRNAARLDYVLGHYRPDLVFHAAAHKHVPLMEDSPNESIKNNVLGTYKLTQAAAKYGVKRFVLISTDKAVNPTNIMGASKRLCEMIVQMMNRQTPNTEFVAVRFGNVLGSNGSVIPLFKKQIAKGGPVTVTHPDIIRYFMTIPEAVSLVLQAGYYAKGGEIFILDMGEPVKIDDMARNLIRLSGYEPDEDIKIEYTGLRPGEKLFEELLMKEEGLQETKNKLIHIGKPIEMDDELFKQQIERLNEACEAEITNMKELVAEIVPTYTPNGQ